MTTYEALMGEISAIQSARDSLPNNLHIGALFELVIDRLSQHAEAERRAEAGGADAAQPELRLAS